MTAPSEPAAPSAAERPRGARRAARRVLVFHKRSTYELEVESSGAARVDALIAEENPAVRRIREAHETHLRTMEAARQVLRDLQVEAEFRPRDQANGDVGDVDLVVTLGGDGTLLWTSHLVGPGVPMLAVNTSPKTSVGYFCGGDRNDLPEVLAEAVVGRLDETRLTRMRLTVEGRVVSERVLNDVLFSHPCPAATSRYILGFRGIEEEQRSSGIWVGPAAGSTAAQRSAGGQVLPLESRDLQFVVREPYEPRGNRFELVRGLVGSGESLRVRNKMTEARLYADGYHRAHEVRLGQLVTMSESPEPLILLGLRQRRNGPGLSPDREDGS